MQKSKINITMDRDLIEYAKLYASTQRTTVSEVFTQFVLNLKRVHEDDPMQIILADPGFRDSLLATRNGRVMMRSSDDCPFQR